MANSPLLTTHLGYDKTVTQLPTNVEEANKLLDSAGWVINKTTGIGKKEGKPLAIKLTSRNTSEYAFVAQKLQEQWRLWGLIYSLFFKQVMILKEHLQGIEYEVLLYGISLGLGSRRFCLLA